jgi:hypothetical protein
MLAVILCLLLAAVEKSPVPSADAQSQATKTIKEVFGEEWAAAKTPPQRQALAKRLIDKGAESRDDKTSQFVLYRLAKDVAVLAGDLDTAIQAIDLLDANFQIKPLTYQTDMLAKIALAMNTPEQHKVLTQKIIDVTTLAMSSADYPTAKRLGELGVRQARLSRDHASLTQATEIQRKVEENSKEFDKAVGALDILAKQPKDEAANLIVGKYYCFIEGNWKKGLPMLVFSGDHDLANAASLDLKGTEDSAEQVKIGDLWWAFGQNNHAVEWYRRALPMLIGLAKDKVEKRINETLPGPRIVAVIEHHWGLNGEHGQFSLWSNGRVNSSDKDVWERNGQQFIIRWAGGAVDACTFSQDGKSYEGRNQTGHHIWGTITPK